MLQPDQSPIFQLVSRWWTCRKPFPHEAAASRAALFTAATHEITANANAGRNYDPMADRRFLWAVQWIDTADGTRNTIDQDLHHLASTFFDPPRSPSGKELASGF